MSAPPSAALWASLEAPWRACVEEAWAAYRAGSLPIGAAVADREGRVLSRGRNRIFDAAATPPNLNGHRLAHAEMNALLNLLPNQLDDRAAVLYTTTEPCPLCVGATVMANFVGELRYASRDPWAGRVDILEGSVYSRRQGIQVVGPEDSRLEVALLALHVEYAMRRAPEGSRAVRESWAAVVPSGVELGERLFEAGELLRMAEAELEAEVVLDRMASLAVV